MKASIEINGNTALIHEWKEGEGFEDAKPVEVELEDRMKNLIEGWVNTVTENE